MLDLDPDCAGALASRGETYRLLKRYNEALADFDRALKLDPSYAWAISRRGQTYHALKRYDQALQHFDRAIESDPDEDWYFYERALIYRVMGQRHEAHGDMHTAIQRARQKYENDPRDWTNTFNLALYHLAAEESHVGMALYKRGLSDGAPLSSIREAVLDLDEFLALFPEHQQVKAMREMLQAYVEGNNRSR